MDKNKQFPIYCKQSQNPNYTLEIFNLIGSLDLISPQRTKKVFGEIALMMHGSNGQG